MKLFGRTSGYYLFWLSFVYLVVGFANIQYRFTEVEYIQIAWIILLSLPLWCRPVGRYFNMKMLWEQ